MSHRLPRSPDDRLDAPAGLALLLALLDRRRLAPAARAQAGDDIVVQAREALRTKDGARLATARQAADAAGHPLAMWVDYWELGNRLARAQQAELDAFYARWPGTYVEDRLRNDWLLELGRRRDWANFRVEFPRFRMNDDREVTCYALLTQHLDGQDVRDAAREAWFAQRDPGRRLPAAWPPRCTRPRSSSPPTPGTRCALAIETNRPARGPRRRGAACSASDGRIVAAIVDNPARWLRRRPPGGRRLGPRTGAAGADAPGRQRPRTGRRRCCPTPGPSACRTA